MPVAISTWQRENSAVARASGGTAASSSGATGAACPSGHSSRNSSSTPRVGTPASVAARSGTATDGTAVMRDRSRAPRGSPDRLQHGRRERQQPPLAVPGGDAGRLGPPPPGAPPATERLRHAPPPAGGEAGRGPGVRGLVPQGGGV